MLSTVGEYEMNKNERKFVGTGKERNGYLNMAIRTEDFLSLPENEKGYRFITAGRHKEVREKGITHWIAEDTFKPIPKDVKREG